MQAVMTVKELADYLRLNELTIYKKVKLGEIPAVKVGRAVRFKKDVIDKWLEVESGWDQEFETLLMRTQDFGKRAGITEEKIQRAIKEVRASEK